MHLEDYIDTSLSVYIHLAYHIIYQASQQFPNHSRTVTDGKDVVLRRKNIYLSNNKPCAKVHILFIIQHN